MLGEEEQPNLPGTVDVHPNWRRRCEAPVAELLEDGRMQHRCRIMDELRSG